MKSPKNILTEAICWTLRVCGALLVLATSPFWLKCVGLVLFCLSFILSNSRTIHGIANTKRFAGYSTLLTFGVALMLTGINWLVFLGIALGVIAMFFSSRHVITTRHLRALLICLVGALWFAFADQGRPLKGQTDLWYSILLALAWAWSICAEYLQWRKSEQDKGEELKGVKSS